MAVTRGSTGGQGAGVRIKPMVVPQRRRRDGDPNAVRQARFVEWLTDVFVRAGNQGISLESLTESELDWIGRM